MDNDSYGGNTVIYMDGRHYSDGGLVSVYQTQSGDQDNYQVRSRIPITKFEKIPISIGGDSSPYIIPGPKNWNNKKYAPVMRKDNKTGEVYFTNSDGTIRYKTKTRTQDVTNMANTDDAMTLISSYRHPKEILYAEYANSMKALANKARKSMVDTGNLKYDPNAKKIYAKEVSELEIALNNAKKNSIKERTATRLAASEIKARKIDQPDLKSDDIKKLSQRSMSKYREMVGSITRRERNINITDRQWEAIQAGAISENKLKQILDNSDPDSLRQKAMPKNISGLTNAQISRIRAMNNSNFTINQIAEKMNVSPSVVSKYLKGAD